MFFPGSAPKGQAGTEGQIPASQTSGFPLCTLPKSKVEVSLNLTRVQMMKWSRKYLSPSLTGQCSHSKGSLCCLTAACVGVLGPTWMQLVWKGSQESTCWLWIRLYCSDLVQQQLIRRTSKGRGGWKEGIRLSVTSIDLSINAQV